MKFRSLLLICLLNLVSDSRGEDFEQLLLSEAFQSEGACVADINRDGHPDIVSGALWYAGPEFRDVYAYANPEPFTIKGYSPYFFTFAHDFNGDDWVDILALPIPGQPAHWFENPQGKKKPWVRHLAIEGVGGESPTFNDLDADGTPELICIHGGSFGYAQPIPNQPTAKWKFTAISRGKNFGRFTHGLGLGDVDGDGRKDLLETNGWWQQPTVADQPFQFHAARFAESGGAQMFAYDFDGDGDQDILSTQNAHGWGLAWFERRGTGKDFLFVRHDILTEDPDANEAGLAISQMHAVALEDLDGDGIKDIVTGKRFWAHGGADPGAHQSPVLYWLKTRRTSSGVAFIPRLIADRVGVGTQLVVEDVNGDQRPDIVVGNKLGTNVLINRIESAELAAPVIHDASAGMPQFAEHVRGTPPQTPEAEQESFQLPLGFHVQLFASEPQIDKPMNMAFDAKGRLWVSSSREYPYPAQGEGTPQDTIKILEDTTGDGRADKTTTFADGLNIPMGLYPYQDGVICFSIPNIWFLRDTNGDGIADSRQVLYGPMGYERDTHGMCNGFTRGLDGWLYACHGFNNQTEVLGSDGHKISMQSGNTFRMRLDGSRVEHFTHGQVNPFGMAMDRWGDLFTADCHTKPISLLISGGHYPSFGKPHDGLGFVPDVMQHLHGSTAIGGIALYEDDHFPEIYRGNAFGGNVMTSRINRNSLHRKGSTIMAREEPDFMTSSDPWFRPVDLQVGPDGALYVADFYNRIIGHYEVPLDHPGRDRRSGRIWRITYQPTHQRVDPGSSTVKPKRHTLATVEETIQNLQSASFIRRQLATDQLVDHFGVQSTPGILKHLETNDTPEVQVHARWALFRLGSLNGDIITSGMHHQAPMVRKHTLDMLALTSDLPATDWIQQALRDAHPQVRRSAATAASARPSLRLIDPLITAWLESSPEDVHFRHAVKMALRDHLQNETWFATSTSKRSKDEAQLIASICLALKTPVAASYLIRHLDAVQGTDEEFRQVVSTAARYVDLNDVELFVRSVRERFGDQQDAQREILLSIAEGFAQRGVDSPEVVRSWARSLAKELLDRGSRINSLGWQSVPYGRNRSDENPWTVSRRRQSSDGQQNSLLHSSFPKGEPRTGIFRSDEFELPNEISFYIAGHDGYPDKPLSLQNFVRLRDAVTGVIIHQTSPPRNDTAQSVRWKIDQDVHRRGYVEIVDGNTDGAYAWLAVGRFSVSGLNPNTAFVDLGNGLELIRRFRLADLRDEVERMSLSDATPRGTLGILTETLAAFSNDGLVRALALSPSISGLPSERLRTMLPLLSRGDTEAMKEGLSEMMRVGSSTEQLAIAQRLASDAAGAKTLLELVSAGRASANLLREPSVRPGLKALLTQQQIDEMEKVIASLPDESDTLTALITSRKAAFLEHGGDVKSGTLLFQQHCAACHQVAGAGKNVGPNLDGIGNRGLDRLTEDILNPNRNVDIAFKASTILTTDGAVHTGLVKPGKGALVVLVNSQGKEIKIASDEIEQRSDNNLSPMPANVGELLDESKFNDLLQYLLSLR